MSTVVERFRSALPDGRCGEFPVTAADRTGVPTVAVDLLDPVTGRHDGAFGYGYTEEQARVGAFGELAEAALPRGRAPRARRASYDGLRRELGDEAVVDPRALVLPAGTRVHDEQPRDWRAARRWRTGEPVFVPAEFCVASAGDLPEQDPAERLVTPITNGSGAGDTLERAVAHGLLELLQRDGNGTRFRAMDEGRVIELDDVRDPVTCLVLNRLADVGIEVVPKLATTAFDMATVHVVGIDHDPDAEPLAMSACGEAVHPDREVALRKALLEYAAARARKVFAHAPLERVHDLAPDDYWERELSHPVPPQEPRALQTMRGFSRLDAGSMRALLEPVVWARRDRVRFSTLPTVAPGTLDDPSLLLDHLLTVLSGFDVLVVASPTESAAAAKVIVPGLEVETMSYGRIGARGVAALRARDSTLVGLGAPPHDGAAPVVLTGTGREQLGDDAWLDLRAVARTVGPLYPLYREPTRHAVARSAGGPR